MRKFSSYGPIDTNTDYYAPRTELINFARQQLLGDNPAQGGHYITIWAPRQTGKTWVLQQVVQHLRLVDQFEIAILSLQSAKSATTQEEVFDILTTQLTQWFQRALIFILYVFSKAIAGMSHQSFPLATANSIY